MILVHSDRFRQFFNGSAVERHTRFFCSAAAAQGTALKRVALMDKKHKVFRKNVTKLT